MSLEKILIEKDNGAYDGDLGLKYASWLKKFSKQTDFLTLLTQKISESTKNRNFSRFNFIAFILQGYGKDLPDQVEIYSAMMDFINLNIEPYEFANKNSEGSIEITLDVFWHQQQGLTKLNKENQIKLFETLKRSVTFRYEVTELGESIFFAIKKSMDLIVFQKSFGNSKEIWNLFRNHFDPLIISEYKEKVKLEIS